MTRDKVLDDKCLYAVVLELIRGRVLGSTRETLSKVSRSDVVIEYCGKPLAISTVHYIEKALRGLRRLITSIRSSRQGVTVGIAGLLESLLHFGFNEALHLLDVAEVIRELHEERREPLWLTYLAGKLGEKFGECIAGSFLCEVLADYFRKAARDALVLANQEITGYIRNGQVSKQVRIKVNARVNSEVFKKVFTARFGGKDITMYQDLDDISLSLSKNAYQVKVSELLQYLRKITSGFYYRFLNGGASLYSSIMDAAIAYGIHALIFRLISEEALKELTRLWNEAGDGSLSIKCSKIARKLRRRDWRVKVIATALNNLRRIIVNDGLEGTAIYSKLNQWASNAIKSKYILMSPIRVYVSKNSCKVSITLRITKPVIRP